MTFIKKIKKDLTDLYDKLSQADKNWQNRPYEFYLILGQNESDKFPWIKSNWDSSFEPYFDFLLKQTVNFDQTGIRVTKLAPEKRIAKKDKKEFTYLSEIKLGKLRWDSTSHSKWTIMDNTDSYFQSFELWAPIWTVCEKRDFPPEIYISITNQNNFEKDKKIQFGYFVVIAVAKNLNIDTKQIIKELSVKINSRITVVKTRRWGMPENVGDWTFVNWIQDTFVGGIYKGENIHSFNLNELKFEPVWEIIYREK
jgi:hypothetical protein